jgi:hypothetical protein
LEDGAAGECKGNREDYMRSLHDGAEDNAEQHEDDEQDDRHDEHERSLGAQLAFILAAPFQCHPSRKFNLPRNALLDLLDEPAQGLNGAINEAAPIIKGNDRNSLQRSTRRQTRHSKDRL